MVLGDAQPRPGAPGGSGLHSETGRQDKKWLCPEQVQMLERTGMALRNTAPRQCGESSSTCHSGCWGEGSIEQCGSLGLHPLPSKDTQSVCPGLRLPESLVAFWVKVQILGR
jgi:hypothetical protein